MNLKIKKEIEIEWWADGESDDGLSFSGWFVINTKQVDD